MLAAPVLHRHEQHPHARLRRGRQGSPDALHPRPPPARGYRPHRVRPRPRRATPGDAARRPHTGRRPHRAQPAAGHHPWAASARCRARKGGVPDRHAPGASRDRADQRVLHAPARRADGRDARPARPATDARRPSDRRPARRGLVPAARRLAAQPRVADPDGLRARDALPAAVGRALDLLAAARGPAADDLRARAVSPHPRADAVVAAPRRRRLRGHGPDYPQLVARHPAVSGARRAGPLRLRPAARRERHDAQPVGHAGAVVVGVAGRPERDPRARCQRAGRRARAVAAERRARVGAAWRRGRLAQGRRWTDDRSHARSCGSSPGC